jgi:hypothetical protein
MSLFPRLFCFIAVSGVSQRWELKKYYKNYYKKTFCKINRVEKFLQNSRPKVQNGFFLGFVLSRFLAFLGEGSSKTPFKKLHPKKTDPGPFLASDPPTHTGVTGFGFWRPLGV